MQVIFLFTLNVVLSKSSQANIEEFGAHNYNEIFIRSDSNSIIGHEIIPREFIKYSRSHFSAFFFNIVLLGNSQRTSKAFTFKLPQFRITVPLLILVVVSITGQVSHLHFLCEIIINQLKILSWKKQFKKLGMPSKKNLQI